MGELLRKWEFLGQSDNIEIKHVFCKRNLLQTINLTHYQFSIYGFCIRCPAGFQFWWKMDFLCSRQLLLDLNNDNKYFTKDATLHRHFKTGFTLITKSLLLWKTRTSGKNRKPLMPDLIITTLEVHQYPQILVGTSRGWHTSVSMLIGSN